MRLSADSRLLRPDTGDADLRRLHHEDLGLPDTGGKDGYHQLSVFEFSGSLGCAGRCNDGGVGHLDSRTGESCGDGSLVVESVVAAGVPQRDAFYHRIKAAVTR